MRSLWYTAYVMFSLLFLVLSYSEWQIPGFVSQVFPLSIVLLAATVTGLVALIVHDREQRLRRWPWFLATAVGLGAAAVVFQAAEAFGAFRLLLAMVTFILPMILLKALGDAKD
jgi:hypothetical protein